MVLWMPELSLCSIKSLEENLFTEQPHEFQKITGNHCRQRPYREGSVVYAYLVRSLPPFLATLRVQILSGPGFRDL